MEVNLFLEKISWIQNFNWAAKSLYVYIIQYYCENTKAIFLGKVTLQRNPASTIMQKLQALHLADNA